MLIKTFSTPNYSLFRKPVHTAVAAVFMLSMIAGPTTPLGAQYISTLPKPGEMVLLSPKFDPVVLKGLTIHPENPLEFDFLVDHGGTKQTDEEFKQETQKLIKYFLAAMTIPENESWVNLSPYEGDRIIPDLLASTEMGKQMLEQDYLLKQLASSLTNPEKELGKKFWDSVYKRAFDLYGTTEIPVNTFNKVWIMPQKAVILEQDGYAFIGSSRLKVMMAEDFEAMQKTLDAGRSTLGKKSATNVQPPTASLSSQIFRETILPEIEKEVNEGKNFAPVRQIYNSVILAAWYKKNLKETLLGKVYADKGKIKGVDIPEKDVKQKVYDQYLDAFRRGVYNLVKEDYDSSLQEPLPRKYFSGGVKFGEAASSALETVAINNPALATYTRNFWATIQNEKDEAKFASYVTFLKTVLKRSAYISDDDRAEIIKELMLTRRSPNDGSQKPQLELVTARTTETANEGDLTAFQVTLRKSQNPQTADEITTLVDALFSSPKLIARGNGLLDSLKNNRTAFEALLLRIAHAPKGGDIVVGDVVLPRNYFLKENKFHLTNLSQQHVLLTLSNMLSVLKEATDLAATLDLIEVEFSDENQQQPFNPLTDPNATTVEYQNGNVVAAYNAADETTYLVLQPTGQPKEIDTLAGDGRVPLALVEAENQSVQGTAEWIKRVTSQLSSRQQELFNSALTAASLPDTNYENYNTDPSISRIFGMIKFLRGPLAIEQLDAQMSKTAIAQRNILLNDTLAETLLANPDFIVNAAQILSKESNTPQATTVVQNTDDGQIIISTNDTNDAITSIIIITRPGGKYLSFETTKDATPLTTLNLNPNGLAMLLSSIEGKPGSGFMLTNGNFQFDADYVLAFAQAAQLPEQGFREKVANFIFNHAKAETSPQLMDIVKTMDGQTPAVAKRTFISEFLPLVFTKYPALISEFLKLFPNAPSSTKRINKLDGITQMSFDETTGTTTVEVRVHSIVDPSRLTTSFEATFLGDLRNIAFEDFDSIAEIEKFLKMIHARTALTPENQTNLLRILAKLQFTKSITLAFQSEQKNFEKKIEDILTILEATDPKQTAVLSIELTGLQDPDMRKEHFIAALATQLTTTHLIGQVAEVLGVAFEAVATIKTKTDGAITTTYDLKTNKSTLTFAGKSIILNGDWRNTTLFDNFQSFTEIAPLVDVVSKSTTLTADRQAQFFQILTAPLTSKQFEKINETEYGNRLQRLLEAARLVDSKAVIQWSLNMDTNKLSPKQRKEDFYTKLLPWLLDKGNQEFSQFAASIHRISLQPLEPAVASSTIKTIDDVTGEVQMTLLNDGFTTKFEFRKPLGKEYNFLKAFEGIDLENLSLPSGISANALREIVLLSGKNNLSWLAQGILFKTLLGAHDLEKNAKSIEEVLNTLEDAASDRVEFATKFLQEMSVLTSEKEKQEKFANFVKTKLTENPTLERVNAIAKLLRVNTLSGEKIGGKFSIFYDAVNDRSEVTIITSSLSGKTETFETALKGDWRNYSFAAFKTAQGFKNIIEIIAEKGPNLTSLEQYDLMEILDEAGSIALSKFQKGKVSVAINRILNLAKNGPDRAKKLAESMDELSENSQRSLIFSEILIAMFTANPKGFGPVALELGIVLKSNQPVINAGVTETAVGSSNLDKKVGGIDFNPALLDLQIKRDGRGVPLPLPMQNIDQINIEGLYPVILNIQPAKIENLPFLMSTPPKPGPDKLSLAK